MLTLKIDFKYISIFILAILLIPWPALSLREYELYVKELSTIVIFSLIFCNAVVNNKKLSINQGGRIYCWFLLLCVFYYFLQASRLISLDDLPFLTHVLISTILNFTVYFIFTNLRIKKNDLERFLKVLFLLYFIITFYFIVSATVMHIFSAGMPGGGGILTYQAQREQAGYYIGYLGGMNGRSWFVLIMSSFSVGYFISKEKYFYAFLCISLSFLASYLMLSRGAMIFSFFLFMVFFYHYQNTKKIIIGILLFTFVALILFINVENLSDTLTSIQFTSKSGFSKRDYLVFESLDLSFSDYFLGRGFHSTTLDRPELRFLGYEYLKNTGTQNVLISILVELGLLGMILYSLFWIRSYIDINYIEKFYADDIYKHYLSGVKYMIILLIISFFFNHYSEKTFSVMPIYMMLMGVMANLVISKKRQIIIRDD